MVFKKYIAILLAAGVIVLTAVTAGFLVYQKYFALPVSPDDLEIWYAHTDNAQRYERYHFATSQSTVVVFEDGKLGAPTDQNIDISAAQLQQLYADLYPYFSPTLEAKGKFPKFGDAGTPETIAIEIRWESDNQEFKGVMIEPDYNANATKIREIIDAFAQERIDERELSY